MKQIRQNLSSEISLLSTEASKYYYDTTVHNKVEHRQNFACTVFKLYIKDLVWVFFCLAQHFRPGSNKKMEPLFLEARGVDRGFHSL